MLIYKNYLGIICGYNQTISKDNAVEYTNGFDCIWIDDLKIEYPTHTENQRVDMYLNEDNTIRYEVVDIVPILKEISLAEVNTNVTATKDTVMMTSEDALTIMELQLENQALLNKIITKLGV